MVDRLPPLNPEHHVGTAALPYKLSDLARVRRRAIQCRLYETHKASLKKLVKQVPDRDHDMQFADKQARAKAIADLHATAVSIKRRIGLIRNYQRNQGLSCRKLTSDMAWIDRELLGSIGKTDHSVCSNSAGEQA